MKTAAAVVAFLLAIPLMILLLFSTDADCGLSTDAGTPSTRHVDPNSITVDAVGAWNKDPQLINAAYVMNAAKELGLPLRAQILGVAVAMCESSLKVLDSGDSAGPDSRGLFQQRDNGAWGSYEDRMDPHTSATSFFTALKDVDGWESLEPTIAANKVQRNADPNHYTQCWDDAEDVVAALGGVVVGNTATPPASTTEGDRTYDLGEVKPHVSAAAQLVGNQFGIETVGGYRAGNSRDTEGHPAGLALDYMVPISGEGKTQGDQVATYLIENAQNLGVKYVIWYQAIWNVETGDTAWRPMEDRGSPTQNHLDHVHVSFLAEDDLPEGFASAAAPAATSGTPMCSPAGGIPATGRTPAGAWGGHQNGRIPLESLAPIPWAPNRTLRSDAAQSLTALNNAFRTEFGSDLEITSAYRDYDNQVRVKRERGGYAATPGKSNHGWALAVDLGSGINDFGTPQHEWMKTHAAQYGWYHPDWAGPSGSLPEPWHWEYEGVDAP